MKYSQPLLPDFFRFLATDEAFFPSAVRTDLGKCAIVRFLLAADAAFFMFFLAAILCLVEPICLHPFLSSSRTEMTAVYRKDIFSRIYAALSAIAGTRLDAHKLVQQYIRPLPLTS